MKTAVITFGACYFQCKLQWVPSWSKFLTTEGRKGWLLTMAACTWVAKMLNTKKPKARYSEIMYGYKNHVGQSIQSGLVHQYPREQFCALQLYSDNNKHFPITCKSCAMVTVMNSDLISISTMILCRRTIALKLQRRNAMLKWSRNSIHNRYMNQQTNTNAKLHLHLYSFPPHPQKNGTCLHASPWHSTLISEWSTTNGWFLLHMTEHARTDNFSLTNEVNNARTELEKINLLDATGSTESTVPAWK